MLKPVFKSCNSSSGISKISTLSLTMLLCPNGSRIIKVAVVLPFLSSCMLSKVSCAFFCDFSSSNKFNAFLTALSKRINTPSTFVTYPSDFGPGSTLTPISGMITVADCDLTTLVDKVFLFISSQCDIKKKKKEKD